MWESIRLTSRGASPIRRIFAYALTVFIAAFLWILVQSPAAYAADAKWSGSDITYDGDTFRAATADGTTPPGIAKSTPYYLNTVTTNNITFEGRAEIIYFASGQSSSGTKATYLEFNLDGNSNYTKKITDTTITITSKSATSSATNTIWSGDNLEMAGETYKGTGTTPYVSDGIGDPKLPTGTQYYMFAGLPNALGESLIKIIYFPPNADIATATSAAYITYTINDANTWTRASTTKSITVTARGSTADPDALTTTATSCDIDGVGWIVCPISTFLATGMDWIFDQLKAFMVYQPLTTTNNSLYQAWTYARSIANVAFVIAFLVIIYSQLTSMGVSNYGIKKLLPRLIVAAVLVNISYWVCAAAVDLSNILGDSLQKVFIGLRESLTGTNPNDIGGWSSITGFVLAGGTAAAATAAGVGIAIASTGASPAAAALLLLPMLLALVIAVLVALVVLAARQAVITLLIIVSPLAFVAYLLPNTDEWFTRWRKLFTTLLVFFPLFSLIFGGSQLAGFLIIQNTDQLNIILLGMFVQVAPIVLTPMLIKLSGSLVGRIAGMVNNPGKGMLDRTKKWSQGQADYLAKKNMARTDPVRNRQIFRRMALGMDQQKRRQDARQSMYDTRSDARWTNSDDFANIDQESRFAQEQKAYGESRSESRYADSKNVAGAIRDLDVKVKAIKVDIDTAHAKSELHFDSLHDPVTVEARLNLRSVNESLSAIKGVHDREWEEAKSGRIGTLPVNANIARMVAQARDDTQQLAVNSMATAAAKRVQLSELGQVLTTNNAMLRSAAGIDNLNGKGEISILANVKSQIEAEKDTLVKNIKIASDIKPGDVASLTAQFEKAIKTGSAEGARAYADLLTASANPGVSALRKVISRTESIMPADVMSDLKAHINSDPAMNSAAEDIATWSRDDKSRQLRIISEDKKTWEGLTANAFSTMKKSSQEAALRTGGISRETASDILRGPAFQSLKPDMKIRVRNLAAGLPYTDGIDDPFKP
jgi:hypothetical protein